MPKYTPVLKETYSQALLSKRGSDILSQSGKLRRLQQVDTSRRGDVAESPRRCHARPAWGLCDDLSPMVYTGLCVLSEVQLLAVNLHIASSGYMVSIVQGAHFSLGLFLEIQFYTLNFHTSTTWPVTDVLQRATFGCHMA